MILYSDEAHTAMKNHQVPRVNYLCMSRCTGHHLLGLPLFKDEARLHTKSGGQPPHPTMHRDWEKEDEAVNNHEDELTVGKFRVPLLVGLVCKEVIRWQGRRPVHLGQKLTKAKPGHVGEGPIGQRIAIV